MITDLDRAWANVYVDEPVVPRLKLGQNITLVTDAQQRLDGKITFISPKAEFTPRNVQTAEERTKLVFRIKVTTDNREGILKTRHAGRSGDSEMTGDAVVFEDVSKRFGALTALDHVSLQIRRGEMFGLIGPDGAGKTTAIRLACGLLRPDGGRIRIGRSGSGQGPSRHHRDGRVSLAAVLTLRRSVDRREHRVSSRNPRRPAIMRRSGIGCWP